MRRVLKAMIPVAAAAAGLLPAARADTVLYSNTTNFSGAAYTVGGTAGEPGAPGSSTALLADDINAAAGSGGASVDSITFSVSNLGSADVTANVDLRFYTVGGNGMPDTLIGGLDFAPIAFGADSVGLYTYSPGSTIFTLPTTGSFWAGEFFTNDGITSTTPASALNNLGGGIFAPPTVGSSNDYFFQSTGGGSEFLSNDPAGGLFFFGGNPVADFGWAFSGTPTAAAVPEPSPAALAGLAGAALAAVAAARRRFARNPA